MARDYTNSQLGNFRAEYGAVTADLGILFPEWNVGAPYESGDYISEGGVLYRCISTHSSSNGTFSDPDQFVNWQQVSIPIALVGDAGKFLKSDGTWDSPGSDVVTVTFTTAQWVDNAGDKVLDIPESVHGMTNGVGSVTIWEANEVIGAQVNIIGTTLQLRVAAAFTGEVTIVGRSANTVALP